MQCADGILTSYPESDLDVQNPSPATYATLLEQTLDAAQTIAQCAQHMKRIVDDILTVSKLDSGLLIITPIDAQPETVTKHAVKMFESEAKIAGVDLTHEVDESYRKLSVNWVSLDPTRLLQVSIRRIVAIAFADCAGSDQPDHKRSQIHPIGARPTTYCGAAICIRTGANKQPKRCTIREQIDGR